MLERFSRKAKGLQVAVEYHAPHWIVLIRNAGQEDWRALRDPNRKIRIQNEFGEEVRSRPAIQAFTSFDAANTWVTENLPNAERVDKRKPQEIQAFIKGIEPDRDPAYQYRLETSAHATY